MHEAVTTALDVLGLLAVAAGVYFGLAGLIGETALLPAGFVVMVVSAWWGRDRSQAGGRP